MLFTSDVTTTLEITHGDDELVCAVRTPSLQHKGEQQLLVVAAGESEPGGPVAL
ncbi:MAG TPA: hypothetical protein VGR26_09105 [Acidimicrobiales bacterium]|nr:hypothetical protein [Acidimicrobiales bacterium]